MRQVSLLFLFVLWSLIDLKAQVKITASRISVEGFITNYEGKSIESVHVVNISNTWGTTSNIEGLFRIAALPGDTIRFTSIGYIPYTYHVPAEKQSPVIPLHVRMEPDTILISGVTVYPWPSDYKALKEAILAMNDQSPPVPDLKLNDPKFYGSQLPGTNSGANQVGNANPGLTYTINGPITALYDAFSKAGKSKRKYESLVARDQRKIFAARRYNAEVVRRITSFKTDKEIQDFMLYCNLSVDFILNSSEYELYKTILDCLLAYNAVHKEGVDTGRN